MGILDGGAHLLLSSRAVGLSLAPRVRHSFCESDDVTAAVRGGVRQLGDHALETTSTQLGVPTLIVGPSI